MKISKILAGMSAAAIVASMAMIPAMTSLRSADRLRMTFLLYSSMAMSQRVL